MIRLLKKIAVLLIVVLLPLDVGANTFLSEDTVETFRLKNGMTFLLVPHGETPIFSAYIRVLVGGVDESQGKTGVAHVIEHMAFKGTKKWGSQNWDEEKKVLARIETVGQKISAEYAKGQQADPKTLAELKGQLDKLYNEHKQWTIREQLTREYQKRGGLNLNATTSQDLTSYFVSLPSSELEFWAETEAERIFQPVFREFYRERDVVLEERRMRVVDDPSGNFYTSILAEAFPDSRYGRPTIGYHQDLLTLTRTYAEEFFSKYYRPDRATGTIVGQFDVKKVKKLLERTFGQVSLPESAPKLPALPSPQPPPYNNAGCRVDITRPAQPRFAVAFHKPQMPAEDDYIFDVISSLLTEDRAARLYRALVIEKKLATSVSAYAGVPGSRLPNLFMIFAVPRPGVPLDRLAEEIRVELAKLKTEPVTEKELKRTQKRLLNDQVWRLETNNSLASELSYFQALTGDWRYLVRYRDHLKSIGPEHIQRVAKKYFTEGNRCYGFLHGGVDGEP